MDHSLQYDSLPAQVEALIMGVPHHIANLANTSATIFDAMPGLNWAGFYILEGGTLVLGPFQGKPACIEIPMGRGVCGTAAAQGKTLVVPDVHAFPGHIACDSASNSEIVLPIFQGEKVWGVLDIDSPHFNRFSPEDQRTLEAVVKVLENMLSEA